MSLRDVERAMQVMVWFYNRVDVLGKLMTGVLIEQRRQEGYDVTDDDGDVDEQVSLYFEPRLRILLKSSSHFYKTHDKTTRNLFVSRTTMIMH